MPLGRILRTPTPEPRRPGSAGRSRRGSAGLRRRYAAALLPVAQPAWGGARDQLAIGMSPSASRRKELLPGKFRLARGHPRPWRERLRPTARRGRRRRIAHGSWRSNRPRSLKNSAVEELLGWRTDGEARAEDRRPETVPRRANRPPVWDFKAQRAHNVSSERGWPSEATERVWRDLAKTATDRTPGAFRSSQPRLVPPGGIERGRVRHLWPPRAAA
jgi:hypothetical protein